MIPPVAMLITRWPEVTPTILLPDTRRFPNGVRLRLRPIVLSDKDAWRKQRIRDEKFLRPVEPTAMGSWKEAHSPASWRSHFNYLGNSARTGQLVPMVIEVDGQFAGQLTLGNIQHGGISDCWIGYWVYSKYTGAGVATAACGLGVIMLFAVSVCTVLQRLICRKPGFRAKSWRPMVSARKATCGRNLAH